MTSRDFRWPEVPRKWRLTGSHLEVAVEGENFIYCTFHFLQGCVSQEQAVTDRNDITSPQVTGSDPEVTSFERKSPGSGCRRPRTPLYCTFHNLRVCSSWEEAVTSQEMMSLNFRLPEVTSFDQKLPGSGCRRPKTQILYISFHIRQSPAAGGSHVTGDDVTWPRLTRSDPEVSSFDQKSPGSGYRRPKSGVCCTFYIIQGCSLQEKAVTWQEMTWRDLSIPDVTWNWSALTGSHLKVAVENHKLAYTVHFTSYKAVARRKSLSHHSKWLHVSSKDRKLPGSDVI